MSVREIGLKLRRHRCFKEKWEGFEQLMPINVIIGRNNSGKSSLLDLIELATNHADPEWLHRKEGANSTIGSMEVSFRKQIQEADLKQKKNFIRQYSVYLRNPITWTPRIKQIGVRGEVVKPSLEFPGYLGRNQKEWDQDVASEFLELIRHPFKDIIFRRIVSDRDIGPEKDSQDLAVQTNGAGTTNLLQCFINDRSLPHQKVRDEILDALNQIILTDDYFTEITAQRIRRGSDRGAWEIHLTSQTDNDRRIALSESGSGLKTILTVLVNLFLVPEVGDKSLNKYFFGFEELENNLHPALQRRLFAFLRKFAAKHKCHFFFTTHSPVVIDLFSDDDDAQLLHVTRDVETGVSTVKTVDTYKDSCHILDDLEARASDLLQANGIVWVEGPSDRIYFNKWVELWSDGELQDGVHFQCLTYGGSVGTHFSGEPPGEDRMNALINLLHINRNLIFLTDSDKKEADEEPKEHIQRIAGELDKQDSICWITAGKEVENYIPTEAVPLALDDNELDGTAEDRRYENNVAAIHDFPRKTSLRKVALAHDVAGVLTREMLENTLDLAERLDEACAEIRKWNGLG